MTNRAMVRIMEKSGMHLEAVRARQQLIAGQPVDLPLRLASLSQLPKVLVGFRYWFN